MTFHRFLTALLVALVFVFSPLAGSVAQEAPAAPEIDRSVTGGAQTLEDILARQRGEKVDYTFRKEATGDTGAVPSTSGDLGTLGAVSDPEILRAMRYGTAQVTASNAGPATTLLMQDDGMAWVAFRAGPLRTWGGYALLGTLALLALFYLLRGKVMIEAGSSGTTIERFKPVERFGHWLLAGSFIVLALTGLISLFGRFWLMPLLGKEAHAPIQLVVKYIHNNVSWAFMAGLIMVTVMWIVHNIPNRQDLVWLMKAGGLFSKHSHPPSRKFNAGQKIVFWGVVLLGTSISLTGLSMLFPFALPMFAKSFALLNATGLPELVGYGVLPEVLTPHAEMQLAQLWHAILAFAMIAMILAHIYIGTLGMEGAYSAMSNGQVDLNWAREHHDLWVEEVEAATREAPKGDATPAE